MCLEISVYWPAAVDLDCAMSFAYVACHLISHTGDALLQLVLRMKMSSEQLPGCSVPALCPLLSFSVPPTALPSATTGISLPAPSVLPQIFLSPVALPRGSRP